MTSVEDVRTRVTLREHDALNTAYTSFPGNYQEYDDTFSLEKFKKEFKIKVMQMAHDAIEFDMIGTAPAIANAIRRILLAEVPTMAIEKVSIENNTSLIHDEVFAHRLGLVPLRADPRLFDYRPPNAKEAAENDTLKFKLQVKCSRNPNARKDVAASDDQCINAKVHSRDLKWIPIGNQAGKFTARDVGPVHPDILLNSLRPGQEIDLVMEAVKGIGQDHAKFSPVATASYRLLPEITILKPIEGDDAERFKSYFSPGVIEIKEKKGKRKAVVANARIDSCSRNVFRDDNLKDSVKLSLVRDHFIFDVESTGALPANLLVEEALKVLMGKCKKLLNELQTVEREKKK